MQDKVETKILAKTIRAQALRMVHRAKASHIGSCLSIADILAVLYGEILNIDPNEPDWDERDRLILSKGHSAAIFYAVLSECGFFPSAWLDRYCENGSELAGHVTYGVPGVEVSAGSLGHGLPIGLGMAKAAILDNSKRKIYVLMSDGECDEGSVWEAALMAPQLKLNNLIAVIDYNKIQSFGHVSEVVELEPIPPVDQLELEPMIDKWKAFRWNVLEVDGHDHVQLKKVFNSIGCDEGRPNIIIAHTIKGKGVSFMENKLEWHYRSPSDLQLSQGLVEIEENG